MDTPAAIPSGTIAMFGGDLTDPAVATWIESQGWLPCDGRSIAKREYIDLFFAIESNYGGGGGANFNLPDLRGVFARGVNGARTPPSDPDATARPSAKLGGNQGNNIGSAQLYATGPAVKALISDSSAMHVHGVPHAPVNNNAYAIAGSHYGLWNEGAVTTDSAGAHTHAVSGGDPETRPININLNYIIKI